MWKVNHPVSQPFRPSHAQNFTPLQGNADILGRRSSSHVNAHVIRGDVSQSPYETSADLCNSNRNRLCIVFTHSYLWNAEFHITSWISKSQQRSQHRCTKGRLDSNIITQRRKFGWVVGGLRTFSQVRRQAVWVRRDGAVAVLHRTMYAQEPHLCTEQKRLNNIHSLRTVRCTRNTQLVLFHTDVYRSAGYSDWVDHTCLVRSYTFVIIYMVHRRCRALFSFGIYARDAVDQVSFRLGEAYSSTLQVKLWKPCTR